MPLSTFMLVVNKVADRLYANRPDLGDGSKIRVYRRKRLVVLEDDVTDPVSQESLLPCVVVAPAPEGERIIFEGFGGVVVYGYPVGVIFVARGNELDDEPMPVAEKYASDARKELRDITYLHEWGRNQLYQPTLPGAPTVFNVDIGIAPAVEMVGRDSAMYDVSGCTATYWSTEQRVS